jgi:hypothetical protein
MAGGGNTAINKKRTIKTAMAMETAMVAVAILMLMPIQTTAY